MQDAIELHLQECSRCLERLALLTDDHTTSEWRELLETDVPTVEDQGIVERLLIRNQTSVLRESGDLSLDPSEIRSIDLPGLPNTESPLGSIGAFHLLEELGSGGMGIVYRARDADLGRVVALKVLRPELAFSQEARLRFEQEARAVAAIRHPNVVAVYTVGRVPEVNLPFLAMEYVAGESLADRIRREGMLAPRTCSEIALQVAQGLEVAHSAGLIHRDIKPSNILIELNGARVKVADFGIARTIQSIEGSAAGSITQSGQVLGSPPYMSPEQASPNDPLDVRSDIYSLGVVIYEMLMGETPFRGTSEKIVYQILHNEPPTLRRKNDRIPRDLETICLKAMAKDLEQRYQTSGEIVLDLQRFLDGRTILARPVGILARTRYWSRRNPASAGLVGAIFLTIIAGLIAVTGRLQLAVEREFAAEERGRMSEESRQTKIREQAERETRETFQQRQALDSALQKQKEKRFDEIPFALSSIPKSRQGWESEWLKAVVARAPQPIQILGAHEWGITAILQSPDGRSIISSGQDGRILRWMGTDPNPVELQEGIWSMDRRSFRHSLLSRPKNEAEDVARPDCFQALCWIRPGLVFAGASRRGIVLSWNLETHEEKELFRSDDQHSIDSIAASIDGEHIAFGDDRGMLYCVSTGASKPKMLGMEGGGIRIIRATKSGAWIVGQENGGLSILDKNINRVIYTLKMPPPIFDMDVSFDEKRIAVACGEPALHLVNFEPTNPASLKQAERGTIPESDSNSPRALHAVRFSPEGDCVAVGDDLGRITLWKLDPLELQFIQWDQKYIPLDSDEVSRLPPPLRRKVSGLLFETRNSLLSAGQGTALKRWRINDLPGITEFEVGDGARVSFERSDPALLWAGTRGGTLTLWDSRKKIALERIVAHTGDVLGVAQSTRANILGTFGSDRKVRFWISKLGKILATGPIISHTSSIRNIAISPDAIKVAIYDEYDSITTWSLAENRQLATSSMRSAGPRPALAGLIAFNSDGTKLAAAGPKQSLWVFDASSLRVVDSPYVVAGDGGTALAWHPQNPQTLAGGDTKGRVHIVPATQRTVQPRSDSGTTIKALAFSPTGDRLAWITSDGMLFLSDPGWQERVLKLQDSHASPTGIAFDGTGRRLAVIHDDGLIRIWEAVPAPQVPDLQKLRTWNESVLVEGELAQLEDLREPAVAIDTSDRVTLISMRSPGKDDLRGRRLVCLGKETSKGFCEEILFDTGELDDPNRLSLTRSLGLGIHGDKLTAVARAPGSGTVTRISLFRRRVGSDQLSRPLSGADHELLMLDQPEAGFDTCIFEGNDGKPFFLHFSHDGHYLCQTTWSGSSWTTMKVGRQGDGLYLQATKCADGKLSVVSTSTRFNGDPLGSIYSPLDEQRSRHPLASDFGKGILAYTLNSNCEPLLLFRRTTSYGGDEIVLRTRGDSDSEETVVLSQVPPNLSGMTCDRDGTIQFAYGSPYGGRNRMILASCRDGTWQHEVVWEEDQTDVSNHKTLRCVLLRLDSGNRPVIVALWRATNWGRLSTFRPTRRIGSTSK